MNEPHEKEFFSLMDWASEFVNRFRKTEITMPIKLTMREIVEDYCHKTYGRDAPYEIRMNETTRQHITRLFPERVDRERSFGSVIVLVPPPPVDMILGANVVIDAAMADGKFEFIGGVDNE